MVSQVPCPSSICRCQPWMDLPLEIPSTRLERQTRQTTWHPSGQSDTWRQSRQDLWQQVHTDVELTGLAELWELSVELSIVGRWTKRFEPRLGWRKNKTWQRRVTSGTTQVDQSTFSQQDDVTTVLHQVSVDLRLDVDNGLAVSLQPSNVDFNVKVTNVTHNGVLWHLVQSAHQWWCHGNQWWWRKLWPMEATSSIGQHW